MLNYQNAHLYIRRAMEDAKNRMSKLMKLMLIARKGENGRTKVNSKYLDSTIWHFF